MKSEELPEDSLATFASTAPGLSGCLAERVLHSNSKLSGNTQLTAEGQRQTTNIPYETRIETVRLTRSRIETVARIVNRVLNLKQNQTGFCFRTATFTVSKALFHDWDLRGRWVDH